MRHVSHVNDNFNSIKHSARGPLPIRTADERRPKPLPPGARNKYCELPPLPGVSSSMGSLSQQLRYVLRSLLRSPMFTLLTVVTIGIGIGANTAIFSVINGILLKPLPYPDPGQLVSVWQDALGINMKDLNLSPSDYFTFRDENRTFQQFGMWNGGSVSVTGLSAPEQVQILNVNEGTLPALGVQPIIGRWFTAQDDSPGSPETVMLSHGYWQRKFGAAPSAIGRLIQVDGVPKEIIGVMPPKFRLLDVPADLILPFRFDRAKTTLEISVSRASPG